MSKVVEEVIAANKKYASTFGDRQGASLAISHLGHVYI